ncbi:hypothetical protein [Fischerella thermalis]|uniref:hypothetical protein n=1 Tax=Fischerella thermalis TaxID=372787 RepID=UPI0015E0943D|nr:hypothetical protein [Fischerella thermalis]MBF1990250.1 hypothetical protein [Fischerella thermalis M58_A2018_009]MBF2058898.1 hypothetical protein [Fischerella thermalis M66_A2018_004]
MLSQTEPPLQILLSPYPKKYRFLQQIEKWDKEDISTPHTDGANADMLALIPQKYRQVRDR